MYLQYQLIYQIQKPFFYLQRHKVNAICWPKLNQDIIVSGDEIGNIVIWDIKCDTTRNINFGKHCIFVLQGNPFNEDIVAFGCRLGLVFIVNITGKPIQLLIRV